MTTKTELLAALLRHATETADDKTPEGIRKQARWLAALAEASSLRDLSWKDLAEFRLSGLAAIPATPEEWVAQQDDDEDVLAELADAIAEAAE